MSNERNAKGDNVALSAGLDAMSRAHDVLNRLHRAQQRSTGVRLSSDDVRVLGLTVVGQLWAEPDPRQASNEPLQPSERRAAK